MPEILAVKDILWNKSSSETVQRAGQKSIDVAYFSTLVEERYLDNFVIDITILKVLQDCQGSKALYLPSETHTLLQTNHKFLCRKVGDEVFSKSTEEELDLLLCPLHMNMSHLVLIANDLVGKKLLFDDGYKLQPDSSILLSVKYLLDVLHELRPNAQRFSSSFWSTADHFERFGMPSQNNCDSTGQGSGSCGVARCHSGSKGPYFEGTFQCSVPGWMEIHTDEEIRKLGDHPGVPLLFGVCTKRAPLHIIMQFHGDKENYKSVTICSALSRETISDRATWLNIIRKFASALVHVHDVGLLHNDIKANNVLLDSVDGAFNPVIIDLARVLRWAVQKDQKLCPRRSKRSTWRIFST